MIYLAIIPISQSHRLGTAWQTEPWENIVVDMDVLRSFATVTTLVEFDTNALC